MLSHLFIEACVDRMSVGFGARTFACVLVCCLVLSIKSDIYRGPLNAAVFPGSRISLNCENENKSNKTKWTFYGTNSTAVSTTYHDSNYVINETKSGNAGTYGCLVTSGEYRTRLVVLESDPECRFQINGNTISSSNSIELKSGDFINMWCQIRFWGDWSPTMHWEITPRIVQFGTEVTTVKSENILKSSFKFSFPDNYSTHVNPPTTFRFFCRTNFTEFNKSKENAGAVLKVASNIPTYNYTWASPDIIIRSTGIPISESGAKQENLVIVINPQTAVILVTCLAAIIIGILLVVILKRKVANNSGGMQILQKPTTDTMERREYCEIDETSMIEERTVAAKKTNSMGKTLNKPSIEQMEAAVRSTQVGEDEVEPVYNNNGVNDGVFYVNSNQQGDRSEGSCTESSGRKNKNYIELVSSTREEPPPPSVYRRLKKTRTKQIGGSTTPQLSPNVQVHPLANDVHVNVNTRSRPKLPTP